MAAFDVDPSAKSYDPRNPPPGPFWEALAGLLQATAGLIGLLVLLLLFFGIPIAVLGWLWRLL